MLFNYKSDNLKKQDLDNLKHLNHLKVLKKEEFLKTSNEIPWNKRDPYPIHRETALGQIHALSRVEAKVLDIILLLCDRYKDRNMFASQTKIGKMAGITRETCNRVIAKLVKMQFIDKLNNGAHKTCWYKVSSFFNEKFVGGLLTRKLAFFFYLSSSLLVSPFQDKITLCINEFNLLNLAKANNLRSSISKEGKIMFKPQVEVNKRLASLDLKLTLEDQQILSAYPDSVLAKAIQKLYTSKPRDPVYLLRWFCKQFNDNPNFVPLTRVINSNPKERPREPLKDKVDIKPHSYVRGKPPVLNTREVKLTIGQKINRLRSNLNNLFSLESYANAHKITVDQTRFAFEEQLKKLEEQLYLDSSF